MQEENITLIADTKTDLNTICPPPPLPKLSIIGISFFWDNGFNNSNSWSPQGTPSLSIPLSGSEVYNLKRRRNAVSHAAYTNKILATNARLFIKASFATHLDSDANANYQVRAIIKNHSRVKTDKECEKKVSSLLGAPATTPVVIRQGISVHKGQNVFVPFELNRELTPDLGIGKHLIRWQWQYQDPALGLNHWVDMETTEHEIFVTLDTPNFPWTTRPWYNRKLKLSNYPWIEVMKVACKWAEGAKTRKKAAEKITKRFYNHPGFVYTLSPQYITQANDCPCPDDKLHHKSQYEGLEAIDLRKYFMLSRLMNNIRNCNQNLLVNCDDCAHAVASLANILGCDLVAGNLQGSPETNPRLSTYVEENKFCINPVQPIGNGICGQVDEEGKNFFIYHTIAWTGPNHYWNGNIHQFTNEDIYVYDGAMKLIKTKKQDKADANETFGFAAGIKFGNCHTPHKYRARLAAPGPDGCDKCIPQPNTVVRLAVF